MYATWSHRLTLLASALLMSLAAHADHPSAVSTVELARLIRAGTAPLILDVRTPAEFAAGHVTGARSAPLRTLPQVIEALTALRGQAIVVYCESGPRAVVARASLGLAGFPHVMLLEGHMRAWRETGLKSN